MKTNSIDHPAGITRPFAIFIGFFLLVEGIWGLFSPVTFGVLTTNTLHACIHIGLGMAGVITGARHGSRKFCIFFGVLVLAVGIMRFIPGAGELVIRLFNVNQAVGVFNIVVGILSLILAMAPVRRPVTPAMASETDPS